MVGAGEMAAYHLEALAQRGALNVRVLGRGAASCDALAGRFGVPCHPGGLESLPTLPRPDLAIVAAPVTELVDLGLALLEHGARSLLIEKPGALYAAPLRALAVAAARDGVPAWIAYNRRFFRSVAEARRIIAEDGGPLAGMVEVTEVEELVLRERALKGLPTDVLERWGVVNPLHVLDLFFFLAGRPRDLSARQSGSLSWHRRGAQFAGHGATESGATFSYWGAWGGVGRWGIEVATPRRKLVLRPLEELWEQRRGSFALERIAIDPEPVGVKPGLPAQLESALAAAAGEAPDDRLCSLTDAADRIELAERIFGYGGS